MKKQIEYAGTCFQGLVRKNNEDNFWCANQYLPCVNTGTDELFKGAAQIKDSPVYAIFDGMGGEECGEVASFLVAEGFDQMQGKWSSVTDSKSEDFIQAMCQDLNDKVCSYACENQVGTMGSTAVFLLFHDQSVFAANVGDSRIYLLKDHKLEQLSKDHVLESQFFHQSLLTQFLGVPREEALLSPCIREVKIFEGEQFLLCSDGLTDMFTDQELEEILNQENSPEEKVTYLEQETMKRGAWDNTTIIICQII